MKPSPFTYHRAETTAEALALLGELGEDGRVLAGGQSLVPMMNFRLAQPEHLVDINRVGELSHLRREGDQVVVGAAVRQAALERSREVSEDVPLLGEAIHYVAHAPIRHRGTVVGSIAHADPAAELPTIAVATDARIVIASSRGTRELSADDFFLGPFETALEPGELVTEVRFPRSAPGSSHAFVEFARRHGDFAIAGAAVSLRFDDERVAEATIVLCAVGPRPHRAESAAELLRGRVLDAAALAEAADAAVEDVAPGADIHGGTEYRRDVARTQVRRALELALARAAGGRHV
jgi:CO/xanthine dehydrogenase FAD-binding subunit